MKSLILTFFFLLYTARSVDAITLSNDTFILQTKDINLQSKTSKIKPEAFASANASPTPEPLPKPFSFSLTDSVIDFGEITPTDPTTRTTTIQIHSDMLSGFSLFALADHELESKDKKIIPDTTCDNGSCTSKYASAWDNILTYGFGYRCCNSNFMQLPNAMKGHVLSPIIFGTADITFKTNISATQDIGLYTNTLQLIAVPDF